MVEWLSELSRSSDLSGRALRRVGRAIEAVLCLTYTVLNYHACRSRRDDRNEYYMKAAKERNNIVQVQVQLHTHKNTADIVKRVICSTVSFIIYRLNYVY